MPSLTPHLLFGTSANPFHLGHRHVVEQTRAKLNMPSATILVSPSNNLRNPAEYLPFEDRVHMASLQMADLPNVNVSDFEAHVLIQNENTRTLETLAAWRKANPQLTPVWLMGADSFARFPRWQGVDELLSTTPVVVVTRPDQVADVLATEAAKRWENFRQSAPFQPNLQAGWHVLEISPHPASTTQIRAALAENQPLPHLNTAAAEYLKNMQNRG